MRLFGFEITKAVPEGLRTVTEGRGGWWPYIRESFAGAWQQNIQIDQTTVVSYSAVFSCVTLIAADIAKLRVRLVRNTKGIWTETTSPAFSPVLEHPNHFQNIVQFIMCWILSKLIFGNTYVLKVRDNRNVVIELYVLDPTRVRPLVAPNGDVYYQLYRDLLSRQLVDVTVPANAIIHDVMIPLYHPLVGVSPIYAAGLAATQGMAIKTNSTKFFQNNSAPGGILTAPGLIDQITADRIKGDWELNFSGANFGRVAVLGDGLKYEQMMVNPIDSQLIEQLRWTAETVCSCFHVPPHMIGIAPPPAYNNIEALNQQYYSQCLQILIESLESCLDNGLELPKNYGTECNINNLLRMDTATKIEAMATSTKGAIHTPNEARKEFDLPPVAGGDTPYMQQQNWSLSALARRDSMETPPIAAGGRGSVAVTATPVVAGLLEGPKDDLPAEERLKFFTKIRELEDDAV